jgi:hypothetical protein
MVPAILRDRIVCHLVNGTDNRSQAIPLDLLGLELSERSTDITGFQI